MKIMFKLEDQVLSANISVNADGNLAISTSNANGESNQVIKPLMALVPDTMLRANPSDVPETPAVE